ncbi:MAG: DUF1837 domain-containing protein [Lachnospiraceae bacterium]|nr:DUF1837 domain-containing protein [Lachnospiraceae bacterium]
MSIQKECFECFDVYTSGEGKSFVYAEFRNDKAFINGLIDYFFKETNLLNYARRNNRINFSGTDRQYAKLYSNISVFLNRELETLAVGVINEEEKRVIEQEYKFIDNNGKLMVQNDKVGKIGEYIFHLLLNEYFGLECILPKFKCITDRNMSVFGIDTLFLDIDKKILFFGESKFCKTIDNGIILINRSLKDYEQQIDEEYRIVLTNDDAFNISPEFKRLFGDTRQMAISFKKFIEMTSIKQIGVPIFIAHGNDVCEGITPEKYIHKMINKISKENFFGVNVKYIFISLPVIDKNKFIEKSIIKVVEKQNEYRSRIS